MAIFISGKTICPICDRVIRQDEEKVAFSAFLPKSHKWHKFSDGVFHKSCFERWPEYKEFYKLYDRFKEIWSSRPKDLKSPEEIDDWVNEAFKEFEE
jgi:hypothetical protein